MIIYAIGGHDGTGAAVSYYQAYQFDDDSLSSGHVIEYYRNWTLDQPRYASACFDREMAEDDAYIIVISGMADKSYELEDSSEFYQDFYMFPVFLSSEVEAEWAEEYQDYGNTPPYNLVWGAKPTLSQEKIVGV